MKIVCDQNMPYVAEAFSTLGEVILKDGRAITAADVRQADLLITRSTTQVNAELLAGSRVRFYGSGVIGLDHIDIPYLNSQGIHWCSAPGCNSESVATYITAALLWLAGECRLTLNTKTLGIIGAGHVGRKVCRHAQALGMRVLINDPPRQRDPADHAAQSFVDLPTLLRTADIITCHVPLHTQGRDQTWHLLNRQTLSLLKPGAILINAARGAVVDSDALLAALEHSLAQVVIDCWEDEPAYRADVLHRAILATPHIAGHTYEGKANGTIQVYHQACNFLGVQPTYQVNWPPAPLPFWQSTQAGREPQDLLRELVLSVYDIHADSQRFKDSCVADTTQRAAAFDAQRRHYPMRREFAATQVHIADASSVLLQQLTALGFTLAPTT